MTCLIEHETHTFPAETGNALLCKEVLSQLIRCGVEEFCLCPGARSAPLVYPLVHSSQVKVYHWPEERSAAFFALGRIKATNKPVAVVTTSGTAVAELFPATMEAYYTALPLVLVTADRPERFRGSGAPQSCEQAALFGHYATSMDLSLEDSCDLSSWNRAMPIHINVCFEEPKDTECASIRLDPIDIETKSESDSLNFLDNNFIEFLERVRYPLVVVGYLPPAQREAAIQFLLHLKAPVYAEGVSHLREDPRLNSLKIKKIDSLWETAKHFGYPIDGILRIGGIPTGRFWRDLEHLKNEIRVCSVTEIPFSGLSHASFIHTSLHAFFKDAIQIKTPVFSSCATWQNEDSKAYEKQINLFAQIPTAEESLIHALSCKIPKQAKVYLGNSLPIRGWDAAATYEMRNFKMNCNRGVNGIDGQLSTFLGWSCQRQDNFALFGDLTFLYDLVAPWILSQLKNISCHLIVINNGGAGIFKRMFAHPAFQNHHTLNFEPIAAFWGLEYELWHTIPNHIPSTTSRLIEIVPSEEATHQFNVLKEI